MTDPTGPVLREVPGAWVFDAAVNDGTCREAVASALVRHGFRPTAKNVAAAVFAGCPTVVGALAAPMDVDALSASTDASIAMIDRYLATGGDVVTLSPQLLALMSLVHVLGARCEADKEACGTATRAMEAVQRGQDRVRAAVDSVKEAQAYLQHPDRVIESACDVRTERNGITAAIKHERDIEAVSGGRDDALLRALGERALVLDEEARNFARIYKSRTGKPIPFARCKTLRPPE